MTIRFSASHSVFLAAFLFGSAGLLGSAQAGGPGHGGFGGPGYVAPGGFGPGKIGRPGGFGRPGLPGWHGPGRFGQYGKTWRGPFARGLFNQPYGGVWGNPWPTGTQTTVYTVPETQRFEIAPELPVVTGGYQPAPVGAPVLYVINAPQGHTRAARVVNVGPIKALGAPIIGPDGDQTPHIVELVAR